MADYQRFVSYIYSYPGGVKDKNVGFAKVEVVRGEIRLNINLRGVYTDTPELFGVYLLFAGDNTGEYQLLKAGDCMVQNGMSVYKGIFNSSNIDNTEYTFSDICGIGIANQADTFYMMFSMWKDESINTQKIHFIDKEMLINKRKMASVVDNAADNTNAPDNASTGVMGNSNVPENINVQENAGVAGNNNASDNANASQNMNGIVRAAQAGNSSAQADNAEDVAIMQAEAVGNCSGQGNNIMENNNDKSRRKNGKTSFDKKVDKLLYTRPDYIDAFDDDYLYDCVEVSTEVLKELLSIENDIINNSFLIHGYYNFRHLLFGRVCENENNTHYFIGVPGMYCNRERYMASMFGFNNFKKSHRSDYSNPYFGYWYQEI